MFIQMKGSRELRYLSIFSIRFTYRREVYMAKILAIEKYNVRTIKRKYRALDFLSGLFTKVVALERSKMHFYKPVSSFFSNF